MVSSFYFQVHPLRLSRRPLVFIANQKWRKLQQNQSISEKIEFLQHLNSSKCQTQVEKNFSSNQFPAKVWQSWPSCSVSKHPGFVREKSIRRGSISASKVHAWDGGIQIPPLILLMFSHCEIKSPLHLGNLVSPISLCLRRAQSQVCPGHPPVESMKMTDVKFNRNRK